MAYTEELLEHAKLVTEDTVALNEVVILADEIASEIEKTILDEHCEQRNFKISSNVFRLHGILHVLKSYVYWLNEFANDIPEETKAE